MEADRVIRKLTDEEVGRLLMMYQEAEIELLEAINRGIARGNDTRYLQQVNLNVQAILTDLLNGSREWCEDSLPMIFMEAAAVVDSDLASAGIEVAGGFGAIAQEAVLALATAAYSRFEDVSQYVGRWVNDIFREVQLEAVRGTIAGYETVQQAKRTIIKRLDDGGIKSFVDIKGRTWNLRSYADMAARTVSANAFWEGTNMRLLQHGIDLVKISTHTNPCSKCKPWQGKIVSLTGRVEGYRTLDDAKAAGFAHPRCRHAWSAWVESLQR